MFKSRWALILASRNVRCPTLRNMANMQTPCSQFLPKFLFLITQNCPLTSYDPHTIRGTPCYGEPLTCQSARWGLWHLACYSRKAFHHHCPACPDDQERVRSHRTRVPHHDCCGCGVDPCSLHRGVLALYFPCAPGV